MTVPITNLKISDIQNELGTTENSFEDLFTSDQVYEGGLNSTYCNSLTDLRTKPYSIGKWRGYTGPNHNMNDVLFIRNISEISAEYYVYSYNPNTNLYSFSLGINEYLNERSFSMSIMNQRIVRPYNAIGGQAVSVREFNNNPFTINPIQLYGSVVPLTTDLPSISYVTLNGGTNFTAFISDRRDHIIRQWNISQNPAFVTGNPITLDHTDFRVECNMLVNTNQFLYAVYGINTQAGEFYFSKFSLNTGLLVNSIPLTSIVDVNNRVIGIFYDTYNQKFCIATAGYTSTAIRIYEFNNIFTTITFVRTIYPPTNPTLTLSNYPDSIRIAQAPF
jgi:hypothetical protein